MSTPAETLPSRKPKGTQFACKAGWMLTLLLVALFRPPAQAGALDPLQAARHSFREFSEREGVPHRNVLALTRDSQGYVWAGTANGIARFDGKAWQTQGLPKGLIPFVNANAAASLADGSVAFGTRNDGLLIWTRGDWTVVDGSSGLGSPNVNAILESKGPGPSRELWVGTWGGGVSRRDAQGWRTYGKAEGLASDQVFCLLEVGTGPGRQIWAGTEKGISIFEGDRWRPLEGAGPFANARIRALAATASPQKIWIGTQDRGLWTWDGRLHGPEEIGLGETSIRSLWGDQDKEGGPMLVVGTGQGLSIWDKGRWTRIWREQGFPHSPARAVLHVPLPPSRRVFWIGTEGKGLLRYSDSSWRHFPLPPSFQDPRVQAVFTRTLPAGQEVWVGGPEGLGRWFDGAWKVFGKQEGLPHDSVRVLHAAPADAGLWIGTEAGLARWEKGRIQAIGEPGLKRVVRAIATDQGPGGPRLWVGLSTGLAVREGQGPWRILLKADGLPNDSIRCILADDVGQKVWVGTDGGLAMWDGTTWKSWTMAEGLPSTWVMSLALLSMPGTQKLWVGHFGGGLALLQPVGATWEIAHPPALSKGQTLPEGIIAGLAWDGGTPAFLATHRGVLRVKVGTDGFPSGKGDLQGSEDGLPGLETSPGALQLDALGRAWLGTTEGLGIWDPLCAGEDLEPKPLHWSTLKGGAEGADVAPGVVLGHRQNSIRVSANLLSMFRADETAYQWQLEGLEPAPGPWTAAATRELVGLQDGSYNLKVWGRDYAGNVSGPLAFPFQIKPAPWRHPLAYFGYLALLAALVGAGVRWRTHALDRKNQELETRITAATADLVEREKALLHQAQNLEVLNQSLQVLNERKNEIIGIAAHDLRSPLSGILLATEIMQEPDESGDAEAVRRTAGKIHKAGLVMMELLQRLLDGNAIDLGNVKPTGSSIDLAVLVSQVADNVRPRAAAKNQRLSFHLEHDSIPALADPRYVRDILENLLSNAMKFSPRGGAIHMAAGLGTSSAWVTVQDEGPGISEEDRGHMFQRYTRLSARPTGGEPSVGLGLYIVKGYAEAMGGRILVESEPGQGATFRLELPIS